MEFESSLPVAADVNRLASSGRVVLEPPAPADIARLVQTVPPEVLGRLREAAGQYNLTALNAHLDDLEKPGEPGRELAGHLRGRVRAFALEEVVAALRPSP